MSLRMNCDIWKQIGDWSNANWILFSGTERFDTVCVTIHTVCIVFNMCSTMYIGG